MRKVVNSTSRFFYSPAFGLLLLRLAVGLVFLSHGWSKLEFMPRTVELMAFFGLMPLAAYAIAWLEVIGGLALILGVATRLFGLLFGIEMLVAVLLVGMVRGISGVEYELLLAMTSFAVALLGSGKYSIYKMECAHCSGMLCNGEAGTCTISA